MLFIFPLLLALLLDCKAQQTTFKIGPQPSPTTPTTERRYTTGFAQTEGRRGDPRQKAIQTPRDYFLSTT